MCETTDPVTGEKDMSALVRVSVVNGFDPNDVLLDMLVMPTLPITCLRDNIHGITMDQLRCGDPSKVATSLRQVQALLLSVCHEKTIIVGHALYNDLKSLKFQHR